MIFQPETSEFVFWMLNNFTVCRLAYGRQFRNHVISCSLHSGRYILLRIIFPFVMFENSHAYFNIVFSHVNKYTIQFRVKSQRTSKTIMIITLWTIFRKYQRMKTVSMCLVWSKMFSSENLIHTKTLCCHVWFRNDIWLVYSEHCWCCSRGKLLLNSYTTTFLHSFPVNRKFS